MYQRESKKYQQTVDRKNKMATIALSSVLITGVAYLWRWRARRAEEQETNATFDHLQHTFGVVGNDPIASSATSTSDEKQEATT